MSVKKATKKRPKLKHFKITRQMNNINLMKLCRIFHDNVEYSLMFYTSVEVFRMVLEYSARV